MVWANKVIPMARGCFIWVKFKDITKIIEERAAIVISENSLIKIVALGAIDVGTLLFWCFEK